ELGEYQRRARRLGVAVEEASAGLEAVGRLKAQVGAADVVGRPAQHLRAPLDEAALVEARALNAQRDRRTERQVDRTDEIEPPEIARGGPQIAVNVVELGLAGEDPDRAARRIAPEQGSLRPAQDFNEIGRASCRERG